LLNIPNEFREDLDESNEKLGNSRNIKPSDFKQINKLSTE